MAIIPSWALKSCVMGIDEAGRGPVLGPMVYGCVYCPQEYREKLASFDFADSKTLKEAKREELFESIKADESMGWAVDIIDPSDLSAQMLGTRETRKNLNTISYNSAMGLITTTLNLGVLLTEVFVDTVGDADKYQDQLSRKFQGIKFTVSKKADSLFPIVSAASIVAKVTRDRALRDWSMNEAGGDIGRDFGSGYPADPETKAWLKQHRNNIFGFPTLVRFSWATCKALLENGDGVDVYWEADEEENGKEDEGKSKKKSRTLNIESTAVNRHTFFRSRQLQQVTTFL
eukprot:c22104_g1_i1 orf=322-1185(-)